MSTGLRAFGYFPSYTLAPDGPQQGPPSNAKTNVNDDIRKGNFSGINDWRRKNIWSKASTLSTPELMRAATGETLQARYFSEHLRKRYLG